jgi:hypothetical protein
MGKLEKSWPGGINKDTPGCICPKDAGIVSANCPIHVHPNPEPTKDTQCNCTAFIDPRCPVHMAKPKLADGTEVTLKAGAWRKSRLGRNYNGRHRD